MQPPVWVTFTLHPIWVLFMVYHNTQLAWDLGRVGA